MGVFSMRNISSLPKNQKSYVCIHVFENTRPVLLVSRPNGSWCFLCGSDHADSAEDYRVVGVGHVIECDRSVLEIPSLQSEEEAEREFVGGSWIKTKIYPDQ
jgi:hypothetical protein